MMKVHKTKTFRNNSFQQIFAIDQLKRFGTLLQHYGKQNAMPRMYIRIQLDTDMCTYIHNCENVQM